ncbi:aspartate/glutamate racemase family protein [Frigidibacter sp. ROC022]|uniref:aspartate/glutamate racemase family protein n=1 Tax=Frigidibacter sp. ROC022 TaxID=2971796 RepID=UPI00215B3CF1|nr:amino acid racemase [Frigidibacter sp. ROC022]MCR8724688.1 amino acid racemase [Frigidibacter sp. ROC022]
MGLKPVGILGGMGPEATVLLMQKVIAAVRADDDADHVPLIVDQNPQVPSRLKHLLEGNGEDPGPVLAAMARRLEAAGARALAIPCNTAHHFASSVREASALPFLDMIALSTDRAAAMLPEGRRVGILASPAVRRVGLFQSALAAKGLTAVYPTDEAAQVAAIRRIKASGADDTARALLRQASADLLEQGAVVQMVACTEFSLIAGEVAPGVRSFDTLDGLVSAIVAFSGVPRERIQQFAV